MGNTTSTIAPRAAESSAPVALPLIGPARGAALHLMSFNIRGDFGWPGPADADYWPRRAPVLTRLLREERPTVLAVQEAMRHQHAAIRMGLPGRYRMLGFGRDGGRRGEYNAVFVDQRRLRVCDWGQFWLSDTPSVAGSRSWGNRDPRIVTWARLFDRATDREFAVANTHLDHLSHAARNRGAVALLELSRRFAGLPMVLLGDFNEAAGSSAVYSKLVGSGAFVDTWPAASRKLTPAWGTDTEYAPPVDGGVRIDWILARPRGLDVQAAAVNPWTLGGRWPSDHAAVQALIAF